MIAKKGTGKEHSKWSPVAVCVMQHVPEIEFVDGKYIIDNLTVKHKKEFVNSCPTKVYRYDEIRKTVEIENKLNCTFCEECLNKLEMLNIDHTKAIKIYAKDKQFIFKVESIGSMRPEQIVIDALNVLKKKFVNILNCVDVESKNFIGNR